MFWGKKTRCLHVARGYKKLGTEISFTLGWTIHPVKKRWFRGHSPKTTLSVSLFYYMLAPQIYLGVILRARPDRGESHIQRHANQEVATTNRTDRTFFLWFLHLAWPSNPDHSTILLPERQVRKNFIGKTERQVRKSFALWQQVTMEITRWKPSIIACLRARVTYIWECVFFAYIPFVVNRTFNATLSEKLQQTLWTYWMFTIDCLQGSVLVATYIIQLPILKNKVVQASAYSRQRIFSDCCSLTVSLNFFGCPW